MNTRMNEKKCNKQLTSRGLRGSPFKKAFLMLWSAALDSDATPVSLNKRFIIPIMSDMLAFTNAAGLAAVFKASSIITLKTTSRTARGCSEGYIAAKQSSAALHVISMSSGLGKEKIGGSGRGR